MYNGKHLPLFLHSQGRCSFPSRFNFLIYPNHHRQYATFALSQKEKRNCRKQTIPFPVMPSLTNIPLNIFTQAHSCWPVANLFIIPVHFDIWPRFVCDWNFLSRNPGSKIKEPGTSSSFVFLHLLHNISFGIFWKIKGDNLA